MHYTFLSETYCFTRSGMHTWSIGIRLDNSFRLFTNLSFLANLALKQKNIIIYQYKQIYFSTYKPYIYIYIHFCEGVFYGEEYVLKQIVN